jgi:hypothetical protein
MLGDNSAVGTEALARWVRVGGFQAVLQLSLFDGVAFDPFGTFYRIRFLRRLIKANTWAS